MQHEVEIGRERVHCKNSTVDSSYCNSRLQTLVGMPDVQNFFHEALALIIAKLQYLYSYQKKAFGELYQALPLSSRTFNVCVSYAHLNFFPYKFQLNENAKVLCLYCTDSKDTNIFVKGIQWDKLRYDFPVFTVSHYGEQAVSFKMVDLPKSLTLVWSSY